MSEYNRILKGIDQRRKHFDMFYFPIKITPYEGGDRRYLYEKVITYFKDAM